MKKLHEKGNAPRDLQYLSSDLRIDIPGFVQDLYGGQLGTLFQCERRQQYLFHSHTFLDTRVVVPAFPLSR